MPLGHSYTPKFRITPLAGDAITVDVSGYSWLKRCQPSYIPLIVDKELINRNVLQTRYGYRCTVDMEFMFPTPSGDETTLAEQVVSAFGSDDNIVELTLDNGTTYRTVTLSDYSQTVPDEKNIGLVIRLLLVCTDVLDSKPAIGSGAW